MNRTKLIAIISLAIAVITMVTSNQLSIYASPTTEDDGYTYPDDATEEEKDEIDEQEQEAWEDAGRPGEKDDDDKDDDDDEATTSNNDLPTCKNGVVQDCQVSGGITCIIAERDDPCMDIWYGNTGGEWPECCDSRNDTNKDDNSKTTTIPLPYTTVAPSPVQSTTINETATAPGFQPEPVPAENSFCYNVGKEDENNGLAFNTEEYQNCLKVNGEKTYYLGVIGGCRARANTQENCELWYGLSTAPHPVDRGDGPVADIACLYDTSLPQCTPLDDKCRDGYNMNEDGRCFPEHSRCPNGYHGHEDDESGECISNGTPCNQGYVMTVMANGGFNCEQQQKTMVINSSNATTTETIIPLPPSTTETIAAGS